METWMRQAAPHAGEIRALRPRADRARRAIVDHARLRGLPASATAAHPDSVIADVLADIAGRWTPAAPLADAASLRAVLEMEARPSYPLDAEIERLRREQHEALHDPAWAWLVDELRELAPLRHALAEQRDALSHRARHCSNLAPTFSEAAARVRAADETARAALGEATASGLREVLDACNCADLAPVIVDDPDHATWLEATAAALTEEARRVAPRLDEVTAQLSVYDARVEELLG